jgi:lipoate-protein ligase A
MIRKLYTAESGSLDPYGNLALEEALLERVGPEECILYLWQNQSTVVIGRNQNAWKECRTELLKEEGGHLARRLSGGGAVFHDLGNLNFTFLVSAENYDVSRQLSVICEACRRFGIPAEVTGRNDVTAGGRKFSGNAFYKNGRNAYHHGTLLIDADMERMGRYLSPSRAKLEARGVESVRSRVVNLKELSQDISCSEMKRKMKAAFESVYGLPSAEFSLPETEAEDLRKKRERFAGWEWIYGRELPFSFSCEKRFSWGEIRLQMETDRGIIRQVQAWSDSMDWTIAGQTEKGLEGRRFEADEMAAGLAETVENPDIRRDICRMISEEEKER